jgi:hypothetical protein
MFYTGIGLPVLLFIDKNPYLTIGMGLCGVFSIVILLFGGWHWYLAVKGYTTIEYFDSQRPSFTTGNWRKNLEIVFGTRNVLEMLLPLRNQLKIDGTYWPDTIHSV